MSEIVTAAPATVSSRASPAPTCPTPTTQTRRPRKPGIAEALLEAGADRSQHTPRRQRAWIAATASRGRQADDVPVRSAITAMSAAPVPTSSAVT